MFCIPWSKLSLAQSPSEGFPNIFPLALKNCLQQQRTEGKKGKRLCVFDTALYISPVKAKKTDKQKPKNLSQEFSLWVLNTIAWGIATGNEPD